MKAKTGRTIRYGSVPKSTSINRLGRIACASALLTSCVLLAPGAGHADPTGPVVSISDADVIEGNLGSVDLVFSIALSKPSGRVFTVDYATGGGTATPAQDYQVTRGTVTFNKKDTKATVRVPVLADATVEPDETLVVTLSNPGGGMRVGDGDGQGLIRDDDQAAPSPPPTKYSLTVDVSNSAFDSVDVASHPTGIAPCPVPGRSNVTCIADFSTGTSVTLTVNADFRTWSGCDSTGGGACVVSMNGPRNVSLSVP